MFDFHMHSSVSFDSEERAADMVRAARERGLREICFTDHYDHSVFYEGVEEAFDLDTYAAVYDSLTDRDVLIRRGAEFGLQPDNTEKLTWLLSQRSFDFIIGSVHNVGEFEIYTPPFWEDKTVDRAFAEYLETTLECVRIHRDFDVLGHLTYASKCPPNKEKRLIEYADHAEIIDSILRTLAKNGKGIEINTSGRDKLGAFLPDATVIRRFRELGGEIVTVGSDAHDVARVGQYADEAIGICRDVFGYVCTFENRKPIYHKL